MDGQTDQLSYRDAWAHPKTAEPQSSDSAQVEKSIRIPTAQGFDDEQNEGDSVGLTKACNWYHRTFKQWGDEDASLAYRAFLDASSHLYKRVCPSVGPSVRLYVTLL